MGNGNGVIGYGKGSGNNFEEAMDKALADCKKNLIAINLDHFLSLPRRIEEQFYGVKLILEPRKSFNSWVH
jgi:small subunit ribosomal protein S5